MDKKTGKYLWCPECKKYPDKIITTQEVWTERKWDKECYEGFDDEYSDYKEIRCAKCDTELENRD